MKKSRTPVCLVLALGWLILSAPRALAETTVSDYIRLHISARSDSAWDQAVKLAVRDAVREEAAALLADCGSADEAWNILQDNLDRLEEAARSALDEWNVSCGCEAQAGVFEFPERVYGGIVVPEGEYRAVQVKLGGGEGKNWWCVLFPALCLPADADAATPVVFYSRIGRWLASLFGRESA